MESREIVVLLAAYNGEKYIREMIDSVLGQDYKNFNLVLSDDGSTDGTKDILEEYAKNYPDIVTHYQSGQRFGSAQKHFMHLLDAFHDAQYVMFCDQDDVWHADKISKTLTRMKELEADNKDVPILVHTDLRVVDANLKVTSKSFCKSMNLRGKETAFNRFLVQNVVTGCTMMVNRCLVNLAVSSNKEQEVIMHDWWIALIASAFGVIGYISEPTIDYRQHGKNVVGATDIHSFAFVKDSVNTKKMKKSMRNALFQAKMFEVFFGFKLDSKKTIILKQFLSTENSGVIRRNYIYIKYKLLKRGLMRKFAQLLNL